MKLTLAEPKLLTDSISIISELVNEVRFKIDQDKLELVAMDPASVAMVVYKLLSPAFTEYEVKECEEIAISLDSFKQILKRAKPSDRLTLELDKKKNRLKIKIGGKREFNLALININEKEQKVPDLKFPLKSKLDSAVFDEAIEDMGVVSDAVAFIANKDQFTVKSESKLNNAEVVIPKEEIEMNLDGNEIKSKYSVEYLKKIIKGSKLAKTMHVQFDNDYPLKVEYSIKDKLSLVVLLAPRVSND